MEDACKGNTSDRKLEDTFSTGNVHRMDERRGRLPRALGEVQEDVAIR
jgi:hypothetical protein